VVLDAVANRYPLIHQDWIFLRVLGETVAKITDESRRLFYVALTRAAETLVIITDRQRKSPFLEEIEQQIRLAPIQWADFPPVSARSERLVVRVGNQPGRGSLPTFTIKDFLKAEGYGQHRANLDFYWVKTFPADGFSVAQLKDSIWSTTADG